MLDKHAQHIVGQVLDIINQGGYKGALIMCGNYILGVNKQGECVACIPELYQDEDGVVTDEMNYALCHELNDRYFDTTFSYLSFLIGLEIHQKLTIAKQFLLVAEDKYVDKDSSDVYFAKQYTSVPMIYRSVLESTWGDEEVVKSYLGGTIASLINVAQVESNPYLLSERLLVRRFTSRKNSRTQYGNYNDFYHGLGDKFTSCSLELFHLLKKISESKNTLFGLTDPEDRICILMSIPDACTSSLIRSGLAVSQLHPDCDVLALIQTNEFGKTITSLSKLTQGGTELLF